MFADIKIASVLLAFIPACLNLAILAYLLRFMPKRKLNNIFSLFLLALITWQLTDTIFRLNISIENARLIEEAFSLGGLALGPLIVHFAVLFTGSNSANSRIFYLLNYGPYFILFSLYHANETPIHLIAHDYWGYLIGIRPGSADLIQRYWLTGLVLIAVIILFRFALLEKTNIRKKKQALIIMLGILIPTIQGAITQVVLTMLGKEEIPVTSTFMTFFSLATIIALNRYRLFEMAESIEVERILNELASFVFFITPNKNIVYLNPSAEKLFYGDRNNNIPLPLKDIFDADLKNYHVFCNAIFNFDSVNGSTRNLETTFINHEKKTKHVLVASQLIFNNRKLQGVLIVANDITERIRLEEKIKISNERYNFVLKATNEAIWDLDITKDLIYWGEGYGSIFGHQIKEGISHIDHWDNRIHPKDRDRVIDSLQAHIQNPKKNKWEMEYRYRKSNGKYVFVLDRGFILRNPDGQAIRMIGAMQDISKIKSYIKKIESQNITLSEIAWLQSHVVRAPLSRIMALASALADEDSPKDEKEMFMEKLQQSCTELDQVIHEISMKAIKMKN